MRFTVVKAYGHDEGLSCCFRQWRAESHCRVLHGYALAFRFTFAAQALDERGWVIDFGALRPLRDWLHAHFDHTLLVAEDDPARTQLEALAGPGLAAVRVLPAIGCETFAAMALAEADRVAAALTGGRVSAIRAEAAEHPGNVAVAEAG
jgi:6-pyruvoyltetrahydropterin/6-carboxytetrahydropterin synthase